ncbi:MAG TPA: DUF2079 domain-containing protein [Ktedonobacterales bacterium]|nr:DUF2079 domain-containing protein [Ktedonobacterales bacterium]
MALLWRRLQAHERAPEPYTGGRTGRIALLAVAVLVLVYVLVGSLYVIGLQNTFGTKAEDLGIMDQVLWNTVHGHFMHQTICNPVGDSNCLGDASRFAIHFEPILMLLAPLYLVAPSVNALLVLQVIVVASGAFPAYLLAARRLRNPLWGVAFALLFLLHPALLMTTIDDFHPETLAATAMMWALYCLAIRRYRLLIVLCIVMLLCKETFALDVTMIGLFIALLQQRWRVGLGIVAMGVGTLCLALLVMHLTSPIGQSPVAGRLGDLTSSPIHTLLQLGTDPARRTYLLRLFAPTGFLPLLSPWVLVLALPTILLNMVSSNPAMYSGFYQYNADVVPVLVAAAVDALLWLVPLFWRLVAWPRDRVKRAGAPGAIVWGVKPAVVVGIILLPILTVTATGYTTRLTHALTPDSGWPTVTAHDRIGDEILTAIPPNASVSAQATLVPHLSQRRRIYQFPSEAMAADYVLLDVTDSVYYPFNSWKDYVRATKQVLNSCRVLPVEARDGYLLLQHIDPSEPTASSCNPELPPPFFAFAYATPPPSATQVSVMYAGALQLMAYELDSRQVDQEDHQPLTITTYWRALKPVTQPLTAVITLTRPNGTRYVTTSLLQQPWLPPDQWQPGATIRMQTSPLYLRAEDRGELLLGVEVRAGAPEAAPSVSAAVPALITKPAPSGINHLPRLANKGTSALLAVVQVV